MIPVVLFGVVLLAVGLAHYAGWTRSWSRDSPLTPYTFLGLAWIGSGAILVGLAAGFGDTGAFAGVARLMTLAGLGSWFVGFIGLFWLPAALRPAWMGEERRERRSEAPRPDSPVPAPTPAPPDAHVSRVHDPLTGAWLPVPEGWTVVDTPGRTTVAGVPATATADGQTFRPNVSLVSAALDSDTDIRTIGAGALAATELSVDNGHVISYDVWEVTGAEDTRRLEFVYSQGDVDVDVVQVVARTGNHAVTLTASRAVAQHTDVKRDIDRILDGFRIGGRP